MGRPFSDTPMVTTDYLEAGADHRVLAVSAETRNIVNYAVMRTSRGDLIDSSPVQRARLLSGKHDAVDEQLAQACASLLSNPDEEAIAAISALGFIISQHLMMMQIFILRLLYQRAEAM